MAFWKNIVLGSVIFLLCAGRSFALEGNDWYLRYFQEKKQGSIEKALSWADQKLTKARLEENGQGMSEALQELGLIHLTRTYDYGLAMKFLVKALEVDDSLLLRKDQALTFFFMASVYDVVTDFSKSEECLKVALQYNRDLDDPVLEARILNRLGEIHAKAGKIEAAFQNYNDILENKDVIDNPAIESEALFNLAHLYTIQKEFDEALRNHKLALSIRRANGDKRKEARSLNDIGELYKLMKNDEKAKANHDVALDIRTALHDKPGQAESYNNIGLLYMQQKNWMEAINTFNLGLAAGQESQAQFEIRRSYDYLSECYDAMGDYKKSSENKDHFFAINEMIQGDINEQTLLKTQNRYEIDKQQLKIAKLETERVKREQDLERQRNLNTMLVAGVIVCLVFAGSFIYFSVRLRKANKALVYVNKKVETQNHELQELNATKDKFFSIISHDLKGPLNSLTSFSSLLINHTDSLSKEEIKMFAQDFDKSLKNLFSLLENLLEWSRSQTGNIEFTPESFDLAVLLSDNASLLHAQADNKGISIVHAADAGLFVKAHKNSVNTVIRNLVSNAIKFTGTNGTIELRLDVKKKEIVVSVADNGLGMPPEIVNKLFRIDSKHSTKGTANEKGTGLGLILCKEFVEKNGGRIWVSSKEGEGSVFSFSLPFVPQRELVEV